MTTPTTLVDEPVADRLKTLPLADRRLLTTLAVLALIALLLGVVYTGGMLLQMLGIFSIADGDLYALLTLHATTSFYYWLYFVQAAVMLLVIRMYAPALGQIAWRRLAWFGTAVMAGGFVLNQWAAISGAAITYAALPALGTDPTATTGFYVGYLLLAFGLFCLGLAAFRTAFAQKQLGQRSWPALTFASVLWWGLAAVSVIASINAYLPPVLARNGVAVHHQASYLMNWSVLFHNMHYLPLIAAVIVWYVIVEDATGVSVKRIYSSRFSKAIFAFYLLVVPPTSLYHMFLSPAIPPLVKTIGSLLALLMSIPTVLHFIVIASSVEVAGRSHGATGLYGVLRNLPWRNPGFACCGWAIVSAVGGGLLANVLVQHGFASLLSDTYFVPAYFHFFTVGTVTLTFLGALVYFLPALTTTPLPRATLVIRLAGLVVVGLFVFGGAGTVAGYYGVPRRTVAFAFGSATPPVWHTIISVVAIGGVLMAVGLVGLVGVLLWLTFGSPRMGTEVEDFDRVTWQEPADRSLPVGSGVFTVVVLLSGWFVLTVVTNLIMHGRALG